MKSPACSRILVLLLTITSASACDDEETPVCLAPPVEHGTMTVDGNIARYACDEGYTLGGWNEQGCSDANTHGRRCLGPIHFDVGTQLEWQIFPTAVGQTHPQAEAYCASLTLEGRTEWRLPSAVELLLLRWANPSESAVYEQFGDIDVNGRPEWSSTANTTQAGSYGVVTWGRWWSVDAIPELSEKFVRCVRGAETPAPDLVDNADGTVTDMSTGLTFQQVADGTARARAGAAEYCAGLALDGGGWRLPTASELVRVTTHSGSAGAEFAAAFDVNGQNAFWTSTDSYMAGVTVPTYDGIPSSTATSEARGVLCVR